MLFCFQKDHLGSPERISNSSGSVIEEYTYNPFGGTYIKNSKTNNKYIPVQLYYSTFASLGTNTSTGLIDNLRLYTGREYDKDTNLYYQRARHYDPASGRFLQQDPIGTKDDVNLYRYVKNSPLNYTDPSGLWAKILLASYRKYIREDLQNSSSLMDRTSGMVSNFILGDALDIAIDHDTMSWGEFGFKGAMVLPVTKLIKGGRLVIKAGDKTFEAIGHPLLRMEERGITTEIIKDTIINGEKFTYFHEGVSKIGYYLESSKTFVGTIGNNITTVINEVTPKYISNLKNVIGK